MYCVADLCGFWGLTEPWTSSAFCHVVLCRPLVRVTQSSECAQGHCPPLCVLRACRPLGLRPALKAYSVPGFAGAGDVSV